MSDIGVFFFPPLLKLAEGDWASVFKIQVLAIFVCVDVRKDWADHDWASVLIQVVAVFVCVDVRKD